MSFMFGLRESEPFVFETIKEWIDFSILIFELEFDTVISWLTESYEVIAVWFELYTIRWLFAHILPIVFQIHECTFSCWFLTYFINCPSLPEFVLNRALLSVYIRRIQQ